MYVGEGRTGWKKVKSLAKECTHIFHRQQWDDGQSKEQAGAGWKWAKEGKMRPSVRVSTIKIKLKIFTY